MCVCAALMLDYGAALVELFHFPAQVCHGGASRACRGRQSASRLWEVPAPGTLVPWVPRYPAIPTLLFEVPSLALAESYRAARTALPVSARAWQLMSPGLRWQSPMHSPCQQGFKEDF